MVRRARSVTRIPAAELRHAIGNSANVVLRLAAAP
jgi:hypothetical protein